MLLNYCKLSLPCTLPPFLSPPLFSFLSPSLPLSLPPSLLPSLSPSLSHPPPPTRWPVHLPSQSLPNRRDTLCIQRGEWTVLSSTICSILEQVHWTSPPILSLNPPLFFFLTHTHTPRSPFLSARSTMTTTQWKWVSPIPSMLISFSLDVSVADQLLLPPAAHKP